MGIPTVVSSKILIRFGRHAEVRLVVTLLVYSEIYSASTAYANSWSAPYRETHTRYKPVDADLVKLIATKISEILSLFDL